jgi:hypothetical protein
MCQCGENHFSNLPVQIHLISWMHIFSLKFECFPFVIGDYFWVWHLCLQKFHLHSTLLSIECRQQSVFSTWCFLPELSISTVKQCMTFLFDHIVLLKNTQFWCYFARLVDLWSICGFLGKNYRHDLFVDCAKKWPIILHSCNGLASLFTSRVRCMTCFWPFGV